MLLATPLGKEWIKDVHFWNPSWNLRALLMNRYRHNSIFLGHWVLHQIQDDRIFTKKGSEHKHNYPSWWYGAIWTKSQPSEWTTGFHAIDSYPVSLLHGRYFGKHPVLLCICSVVNMCSSSSCCGWTWNSWSEVGRNVAVYKNLAYQTISPIECSASDFITLFSLLDQKDWSISFAVSLSSCHLLLE